MEKHCVSLEIAEQLKEVGWRKETEFWWKERLDGWELISDMNIVLNGDGKWFPAPLATEILEDVNDTQVHYYLMQRYGIATTQSCLDMMRDVNEVAKMWLYKKENLL